MQNISDRNILGKYYTKYESDNNFLLVESNIFDNVPVEGFSTTDIDYAFPQPFRYSNNSEMNFPTTLNGNGIAELYIYSTSIDLVYSGHKHIVATNKIYITWETLDNKGNKLGTGVYLYVTKSGDNIKKGKFVNYND